MHVCYLLLPQFFFFSRALKPVGCALRIATSNQYKATKTCWMCAHVSPNLFTFFGSLNLSLSCFEALLMQPWFIEFLAPSSWYFLQFLASSYHMIFIIYSFFVGSDLSSSQISFVRSIPMTCRYEFSRSNREFLLLAMACNGRALRHLSLSTKNASSHEMSCD